MSRARNCSMYSVNRITIINARKNLHLSHKCYFDLFAKSKRCQCNINEMSRSSRPTHSDDIYIIA